MTTISIITPTLNSSKNIGNLIETLENEHLYIFEWIIVDSYSTDNTINKIQSARKPLLEKTRIYYEQANGPYSAMNTGILKCKGSYICLINSDDKPMLHSMKILKNRILESSFSILYGRVLQNNKLIGDKSFINWNNTKKY